MEPTDQEDYSIKVLKQVSKSTDVDAVSNKNEDNILKIHFIKVGNLQNFNLDLIKEIDQAVNDEKINKVKEVLISVSREVHAKDVKES